MNIDLLDAIRARSAARQFVKRAVPDADLSTIVWAANGQKQGTDAVTAASKAGRTIPYSGDNAYINLYILTEKGVYRYEPDRNLLRQVGNKDARSAVTPENLPNAVFMALFTVDAAKAPSFVKGNAAQLQAMAHGTAGYAAENMALAAAGLKLNSIVMYNIKPDAVKDAAKLGREESPLFIMQVGYAQ